MTQLANTLRPLLLLLVAASLAYATHLTQKLGAHPWWADKVIWIGLPVGFAMAATAWKLRLPRPWRITSFAVLAFVAFAVAHTGKARFAASYAEDMFAGQMWYFGWIGACTMTFAALASLTWAKHQTH
jgi:hypothetical protein